MEKETRETKQDLQEIEVLDEGLDSEDEARGLCCVGALLLVLLS